MNTDRLRLKGQGRQAPQAGAGHGTGAMRTPAAFRPHEAPYVEIFHEGMEAIAGLGFNLGPRSTAGAVGETVSNLNGSALAGLVGLAA